jgi:hypothetical protein
MINVESHARRIYRSIVMFIVVLRPIYFRSHHIEDEFCSQRSYLRVYTSLQSISSILYYEYQLIYLSIEVLPYPNFYDLNIYLLLIIFLFVRSNPRPIS